MEILICEDEEILLTAMEFRMRKIGLSPTFVSDYSKVRETLQSNHFGFIILDISEHADAGMDIITFCREDLNSEVPIILIAEMEQEEEILAAKSKGIQDFTLKPFKPAELMLRIKSVLSIQ